MAESNRFENGHPSDGIVGSNPTLSEFPFPSPLEGVTFRYTDASDEPYLANWLRDPSVFPWFPMGNEAELVEDARIWIQNTQGKRGITALIEGVPVGIISLNSLIYQRCAHHTLVSIIVDPSVRGKGIGTALLQLGIRLAKEEHGMQMLYLEVYEGNPAIRLYERMGFKEFGRQPYFLKDADGKYSTKIFMEKWLEDAHGRP